MCRVAPGVRETSRAADFSALNSSPASAEKIADQAELTWQGVRKSVKEFLERVEQTLVCWFLKVLPAPNRRKSVLLDELWGFPHNQSIGAARNRLAQNAAKHGRASFPRP